MITLSADQFAKIDFYIYVKAEKAAVVCSSLWYVLNRVKSSDLPLKSIQIL